MWLCEGEFMFSVVLVFGGHILTLSSQALDSFLWPCTQPIKPNYPWAANTQTQWHVFQTSVADLPVEICWVSPWWKFTAHDRNEGKTPGRKRYNCRVFFTICCLFLRQWENTEGKRLFIFIIYKNKHYCTKAWCELICSHQQLRMINDPSRGNHHASFRSDIRVTLGKQLCHG